jgi:hypothetical protein
MASKGNQKKVQSFFVDSLNQVNGIINKFEKEVEKAIRNVRSKGKKSTKTIIKSFDEIIDRLGAGDIKNLAVEKTDELKKEIAKLSEDIVENIRNIELNLDASVFKNIRQGLNSLLQKVQDLEIVEFAKGKVADTKNQFLTLLRIPSLADLDSLSRKVISLERKLGVVEQHGKSAKRQKVAAKAKGHKKSKAA